MISPLALCVAAVVLVLILLAWKLRRCGGRSSRRLVVYILQDIDNIIAAGEAPDPAGAFYRHFTPRLSILREDYSSVARRWPDAAPFALYNSLANSEAEFHAVARAGETFSDSAVAARAAASARSLPRRVRQLGDALDSDMTTS